MIEEVAERVWSRPEFQAEYRGLLRRGIQEYVRVDGDVDEVGEGALVRLLQSATHFAGTTSAERKEAAYRIASCSWALFGVRYQESLRDLLCVIFGRLGNFPAIQLLFRDLGGVPPEQRAMLPGEGLGNAIWMEIKTREMNNEVLVTAGRVLTLTDFQRRLWEALSTGRSATVTAPTSAGKSFALQYYLGSRLAGAGDFLGLYIVPTRSLIHQVSTALRGIAHELTGAEPQVVTVPVGPEDAGMRSGIYVLTQERLQILLELAPSIRFGMVVVDEAQTIASDSRGIILHTVIDRLSAAGPTQFLFSSPTAANPQVFAGLFGLEGAQQIDEAESPVAQNLVFLDADTTFRRLVRIEAWIRGTREAVGTAFVGMDLLQAPQTLAALSWHFGREDQNLVYVGSQAAAEDVASMISQNRAAAGHLPEGDALSELQELAQFLRDHVHPQYLLADTVLAGVAFHYGQMPSVVRQAIEDFFDEGLLRFLVSTSTLLHGVNLPAKNLFLLDPTKGGEWNTAGAEAISGPEFWNLAGRAGRLGREFEGNVFVINHRLWRSDPVKQNPRQHVKAAFDEHVQDRRAELVAFARDPERGSGSAQGLESAFVRLFNEARRGTLDATLARIYGADTASAGEVKAAVEAVVPKVKVSTGTTSRHITVSVYRQQEMYDYLLGKVRDKGPGVYIPPHPLSEWKAAYQGMLRLLKRVHSQFERRKKQDNSHKYFAGLALRWMRGDPLPLLINDAFEHKKKTQKKEPSIATVIRNVMGDIENDLRFRYVKYLGCYGDILRQVLRETGNDQFIDSIPALPLYLELGASSDTMVSLISLGLSRTAAVVIAGKAANPGMNQRQAEAWLLAQNLEGLGVPGVCIREVEKLLHKP